MMRQKKAIAEESINNIVQAIENSPDFRGKKEILGFIIIEGDKELKKFAQNLSELLNIEIDYSEYEWYLEKYEKKEDSIELAKVLNKYIQENRELFESKIKEVMYSSYDGWEIKIESVTLHKPREKMIPGFVILFNFLESLKNFGFNPEECLNNHFEEISEICLECGKEIHNFEFQNPDFQNFVLNIHQLNIDINFEDFVSYKNYRLVSNLLEIYKGLKEKNIQINWEGAKNLLTYLEEQHYYRRTLSDLDKIILLSQDKENLKFIQKLNEYGYRFNASDLDQLPEIIEKYSKTIDDADVKEILTYLHQQHNYGLVLRDLDKIISLSQDKENLKFIQKLNEYGYRFNSNHLEFLSDLCEKESEIIPKLDYIKKYFPEFRYEPIFENGSWITDPYEILIRQVDIFNFLYKIEDLANESGLDYRKFIEEHFNFFARNIKPDYIDSILLINIIAEKLEISKWDLYVKFLDKLKPLNSPVLKRLTSPEDKDYASFPLAIARIMLGLEQEYLDILETIYQSKTLQEGKLEREYFLNGLIFLSEKESGKEILVTLLGAYKRSKGGKNNIQRIRKIFQLLSILDVFDSFGLEVPSKDRIDQIEQKILKLDEQLKTEEEKSKKKNLKNEKEKLQQELEAINGLIGIEDIMVRKIAKLVIKRLELGGEYIERITSNIDNLMKNNFFKIVASLFSQYESRNLNQVKEIFKTIIIHIIDGDFKSWRYSHEQSQNQLDGLTEEQRKYWQSNLGPIYLHISVTEEKLQKWADQLTIIKSIIENVKDHITIHMREKNPDFNPEEYFSEDRLQKLENELGELNNKLKQEKSEDEKQNLAAQKRKIQDEINLIRAILYIENINPENCSPEEILSLVESLRKIIERLRFEDDDIIRYLESINRDLLDVGDIKKISSYETDDPFALLNVGVEPRETCQSWRGGSYNQCLLAYVADSNKKIVNIANENKEIIGRTVIKLTDQKDINDPEGKTKRKTILVERPYLSVGNESVYRILIRLLLTKAQEMGVSITLGGGDYSESTIRMFQEEAEKFGYRLQQKEVEVFIPQSLNAYEYSDLLGGPIQTFNVFKSLSAIILERNK